MDHRGRRIQEDRIFRRYRQYEPAADQGSRVSVRSGLCGDGVHLRRQNHGERPDYVTELANIIQETFDRGGNVVIPAFAVGRTQEMLYFIREIKEKGLVTGHAASRYSWTVRWPSRPPTCSTRHSGISFDEDAMEAHPTRASTPSSLTALNLAVSPMNPVPSTLTWSQGYHFRLRHVTPGRIKHHLKHNLWRERVYCALRRLPGRRYPGPCADRGCQLCEALR